MHNPLHFTNQPQLFNLHKNGDTDPWEQEEYFPDIIEQPLKQIMISNQKSVLPNERQTTKISNQQPASKPIAQPLVQHSIQSIQSSLNISEDPNNFEQNNPQAYFEYLQMKYMNPEKENKENIPKENEKEVEKEVKEKKKIVQQVKSSKPVGKKPTNFDTAYTQLAERLQNQNEMQYQTSTGQVLKINELLIGPKDVQKIEKKHNIQKKINENNFGSQRNNKSQISNADMMSYEEKQLQECTFEPKINKKGNNKRRSFNVFLENQKLFQMQVEEKKNKLKDQIQYEESQKIQNTIVSKKATKTTEISVISENQNVYERLYQKANESFSNCQSKQGSQYMPEIGEKSKKIQRNEKIENLLYQDALRRQQVQKLNEDIKNNKEKLIFKKVVSQNSKKILIEKFLKEFTLAMQIILPMANQSIEFKLDYLQLGEILKTLGFLQLHANFEKPSFSNERTILYEIWAMLRGDQFGGILKRNLCIFLMAVLGLHTNFPPSSERQDENSFGNFEEETQEWEVNQDEAKILQTKFDLLYRNKLQTEELKKIREEEQYEFKPQISETSKILAEHYRERLLEETASLLENNELDIKLPQNGKISHTDLLVMQRQAQLAEHQKKHDQQTEEELSQYSIQQKPSQQGMNRGLELYKLAKPQREKHDRDRNEIEYEKALDVCTFQPNLNKRKVKSNSRIVVRNVDKAVERMRLARKERDLINSWKSRGVPNQNIILELNQLNDQLNYYPRLKQTFSQEEAIEEDLEQPFSNYQVSERAEQKESEKQDDDRVPLLFVDVNLGPNTADRIIVFEGQSAEDLAEEFAQKHDLDDNLKEKLVDLLNDQISGLLSKIEEEGMSEDEDDEYN